MSFVTNDSSRLSYLFAKLNFNSGHINPEDSGLSADARSLLLSNRELGEAPDFKRYPQLVRAHLDHNQLTVGPKVECCTLLELLDLSSNCLTESPVVRECPQLRTLRLRENRLTENPDLTHNWELESLDLSLNQLLESPVIIHCPRLRILSLEHNLIKEIPEFKSCEELISLNLAHNDLIELPNFLIYCPHLLALEIDGNPFVYIANQIVEKFPHSKAIDLFKSQLEYVCESELGKFCQMLMQESPTHAKVIYNGLKPEEKTFIENLFSNVLCLDMFEDFSRMRRLIKKGIEQEFDHLLPQQRTACEQKIFELAASRYGDDEATGNPQQWGIQHAKENFPRLADALAHLNLFPSR